MHSRTFTIAAVLAAAFCTRACAETYLDPQQRFTLAVPAGWTAEPFDQGVQLKRGAAFCVVLPGRAATAEELLHHLVGQFGSQWTQFQQLKQSTEMVDGRPAPFSFNSGVNKGVPQFLKVTAVGGQGQMYGIIAVVPEREFQTVKAGVDQIAQGFHTGSGSADSAQRQPQPPPQRQMPPAGAPFVGLGLDQSQNGQGALIGAVAPGGPAERAGLQPGDTIVAVNGRRVTDPAAVPATVRQSRPGDTLQFTVVREGRQGNVQVVVGTSPGAAR